MNWTRPRNIAEGFGGYKPPQFRQFPDVAIASLFETSNNLRDGVDRKHFAQSQIDPLQRTAKRATAAAISLKQYLENAAPPDCPRQKPRRKPKNPDENPRT